MVHRPRRAKIFHVKVENPFVEPIFLPFTITRVAIRRKVIPDFMPTDAAILVPVIAGFLGALAVTGIGIRFTRNLRVLTCSAVFSAAASGALIYVLWSWFTHGFVWFQISVPPLAALILLLVMTAQNWFVFYENRRDVLQSSLPALVVLAACAACVLARLTTGKHTALYPLIWAGAASLAILLCIDPVQRSIERTRSVPVGTLVGMAKLLIPFTGIVVFLRWRDTAPQTREDVDDKPRVFGEHSFFINLIALFWTLGQLLLVILINGTRVPASAAALDPLDMLGQPKTGQSITGEMSRLKRDSVVLIFVLAIHVLCGVVLAKA